MTLTVPPTFFARQSPLSLATRTPKVCWGRIWTTLATRAGAIQHWTAAVHADPTQQYQDRFDDLQRKQLITDRAAELGNFALEAANAQNWPQAMEQMNALFALVGRVRKAPISTRISRCSTVGSATLTKRRKSRSRSKNE